jgi:hypothetical protein
VGPTLGEDVLKACQKTSLWAEEPQDFDTRCVICKVVPGHVIIMDVFVEMQECVEFVNSFRL